MYCAVTTTEFESDELALRKTLAQQKVQTGLELLRTDEDEDPHVDDKALELIEAVCQECGVECDSKFVGAILQSSQSPWETVKHDLVETIKGGKHRQVHGHDLATVKLACSKIPSPVPES